MISHWFTSLRTATAFALAAGLLLAVRVEAAPEDLPLITKDKLEYAGAFRVPTASNELSSFAYGGRAPAYNPARHSLFMMGHSQEQMAAEISIPELKTAAVPEELALAEVLQPFADPTDGLRAAIDPSPESGIPIGGLLVWQNKLIWGAYDYYDANYSQEKTHGLSSLDLSLANDAEGPFRVGTDLSPGLFGGYMGEIPLEWQPLFGKSHLTGLAAVSIVSRTSDGPAAFAFNPEDLGRVEPVEAHPLVYYPYPDSLEPMEVYQRGDRIRGVVFPRDTRSVLFFGTKGLGERCYGPGHSDPNRTDGCYDPANSYKGYHSYPYVYFIWAYDALELLKVKRGEVEPWSLRPYAAWELSLPFSKDNTHTIGGVAYDSRSNVLYVSQHSGWYPNRYAPLPVIHAFKVNVAGVPRDVVAPAAPNGLRYTVLKSE